MLCVIKRQSSSFIHEVYIIAAVAECVVSGPGLLTLALLSCEDPFWGSDAMPEEHYITASYETRDQLNDEGCFERIIFSK